MKVLLVTGGAGFIGSNFITYFLKRNKNYILVNIDKLTYAGNINNLRSIENNPRYHFIKGDICNYELVNYVFRKYKPDHIINFAAESHVDRSISHPSVFVSTNILGTMTLLEGARHLWGRHGFQGNRFLQVSTDEVYGSLDNSNDYFLEESNLDPSSPYSASKAGADLMVGAFAKTYGLPVIITRCCNNYGPYQYSEKFIPTCVLNALQDNSIPIYGDGTNVREWIHVQDHCIAIIRALFYGKPGQIYNIGTGEEVSNLEMAARILKILDKPQELIRMVKDRPGHDKRYALNSYKIKSNLNWSSKIKLEDGLTDCVRWYKSNPDWFKE
ncbi:dTDP-glucose 4,6-dehydratase [Anaerobacterium chartisolvens]|uniref:dTDP-glucose 4,6-dehydratase n=1 Tax=Anaerobacterium chartisolvens TaxID=1297424 RepID=A0A369B8F8_9FIRM|nr:dTDP-glucose 4,6-dehydratase [Anaerobacterium chartisolvens]RCX16878.1 dTDP-glucose 4,6-dehydratase [Anaerobacterium chartisolvens]